MKNLLLEGTYVCPVCNKYKRLKSKETKTEVSEIPLSEVIIEKIDRVIGIFSDKGIKSFKYLTPIENLDSIMKNGIMQRNVLSNDNIDFRDISKEVFQNNRQECFKMFFNEDHIHNYVPLFISSHTRMIRPIAVPFKQHFAVLKLDPFLFYGLKEDRIKEIKISNSSINLKYPHSGFKVINLFKNINQIEKFLDWELFDTNIHYSDIWKGQKKSAEILIPSIIPPNYIAKICPKCSENVLKKHIRTIKILELADFNNNEFDFINEESTEIIHNFIDEDLNDISKFYLDDDEEEDERDGEIDNDDHSSEEYDDWKKFEGLI
ncbi:hypothetical protein LCGC14_0638390 [marine sediment metagenome]|uniref:DarT domain-containing protein n=1 Tax=marine sediment metagenome TaxID=412755 RepID=A0A0F9R582_9ZZZZ